MQKKTIPSFTVSKQLNSVKQVWYYLCVSYSALTVYARVVVVVHLSKSGLVGPCLALWHVLLAGYRPVSCRAAVRVSPTSEVQLI